MRIFYCCYGSTHSSVVAASIHLGLLPIERIPTSNEIKRLPYYDKIETSEIGTPFYMGKDEFNSEIFILGMANHRKLKKGYTKFFRTFRIGCSRFIDDRYSKKCKYDN